jgi:2-oxo-3-hexenedioate decarboxylase
MTTALDLFAIAKTMKEAQDHVHQLPPLTTTHPEFDVPAAYTVAQLIHQARLAEGFIPVGRKIGFTNYDMWDLYGVREPIWAYVYDRTVRYVNGPGTDCTLSRYAEPKIEPEIIFHFKSAPPVTQDLEAILECIDWVAHGFEIVQSHFPHWRFEVADTVADWSLHATLLIGTPQTIAQLGRRLIDELENFCVDLSCHGELKETGRGTQVLGSPLKAIAHLLEVLSKQGVVTLQAGEIVTTGTITTAQTIHPGETWQAELQGIGLSGMTVTFTH